MKTGLVLEGGGMRGLYTVGVLDRFMEQNWVFDYVIGVSAGACNALSFLSGQTGRGYRINTAYLTDKRYLGIRNFFRTRSMFGMDFIFDEIPHKLDPFDYDALLASPAEFITGVTDVETGRPVYFDKTHLDHDSTIVRASSAIPCFSPMVEYQGKQYLDGGTSAPIPIEKAIEDGCERIVVVLTRPRDYVRPPERMRWYYRRHYRNYPAMVALLEHRHEIYAREKKLAMQLECEGRAVVIAPEPALEIDRFEKRMHRLNAAYQRGYEDAKKAERQLASFLVK